MDKFHILPRLFYQRDTVVVAQELLGCLLIRHIGSSILIGKIVETEAYNSNDPACHAFRGKTLANQILFGPVGHAYVYFIYGNHYCFNAVARTPNVLGGGVLIRALEPVEGIEYMQQMRTMHELKNLTNGPGKLAQALHITKELSGIDLTQEGPLYIIKGDKISKDQICSVPRIGIKKAQEKLWRFYIANNAWVSKK